GQTAAHRDRAHRVVRLGDGPRALTRPSDLCGAGASSRPPRADQPRIGAPARYLDTLLQSVPVAIAVIDRERRIRSLNRQFTVLFGYEANEAVGRPLDELVVPEAQRTASRGMEQRVWQGEIVTADTERLHRDGRLIPVRLSAA